jgi:homoserine kinase type II
MAVYTPLTDAQIASFLEQYDVGPLVLAAGIAEGIENTNYLVHAGADKYILTLFEQRAKLEDLPYFTTLMQWLHGRGIPCPLPIARRDGRMLGVLREKPALMVSFLEGSGVAAIRPEHLPQLGLLTARMHLAGMEFPHRRDNALSLAGWEALIEKIGDRADEVSPGLFALQREEFNFLSEHWPSGLPSGPVHADLFPDNVFFLRDRGAWKLSGVIDFYFACNEAWAYDLAICINAWCFDGRHRFIPQHAQALMASYCDARSLTPEEERAMPLLLRGAALRFLLTRTHDWLYTPSDALVTRKDPMEYLEKLKFHQTYTPS